MSALRCTLRSVTKCACDQQEPRWCRPGSRAGAGPLPPDQLGAQAILYRVAERFRLTDQIYDKVMGCSDKSFPAQLMQIVLIVKKYGSNRTIMNAMHSKKELRRGLLMHPGVSSRHGRRTDFRSWPGWYGLHEPGSCVLLTI